MTDCMTSVHMTWCHNSTLSPANDRLWPELNNFVPILSGIYLSTQAPPVLLLMQSAWSFDDGFNINFPHFQVCFSWTLEINKEGAKVTKVWLMIQFFSQYRLIPVQSEYWYKPQCSKIQLQTQWTSLKVMISYVMTWTRQHEVNYFHDIHMIIVITFALYHHSGRVIRQN